MWSVPGDEAWRRREKTRKRKEYTLQAVLVLLLVSVLASLSLNVAENLEAKNIRSGFDFLFGPAGFDIGEKLIAFQSLMTENDRSPHEVSVSERPLQHIAGVVLGDSLGDRSRRRRGRHADLPSSDVAFSRCGSC